MKLTLLALAFGLAGGSPVAAEQKFESNWSKFAAQPASVDGVRIVRLTAGRTLHRFFDTSPISPSGRYVALFRFPQELRSPQPGEIGEVLLVDLQTGEERVVAQSRGYETQLGANVQWGATDEDLFFNDVDPATWRAFAVKLNPLTGAALRLDGTVFLVSPDGKQLASYNLLVSRFAQVGYGVMVPTETIPLIVGGPSAIDGVELTDVATGKTRVLVTLKTIVERTTPRLDVAHPEAFQFHCFQVKWNLQGTRLLTTVQWTTLKGGPRRRSVITMRPDGSELRTAVTPEQWAKGGHHINWMADGEHLSMNLDVDGQPGLELITVRADGSDLKVIYKPGSGHPSQNPTGSPFVITDAYPDEPVAAHDGTSPLRLIDLGKGTEQTLVSIFVSMTAGEFRVDPHPAWDRTGRFVVFNGFVGGTRNVFLADLRGVLRP